MPEKHMTPQDISLDIHTLTEDIESCKRTIQAPSSLSEKSRNPVFWVRRAGALPPEQPHN